MRFYRDISIADFVFATLSTVVVSYTSFSSPYVRTTACEELSRHAELIRDMTEMGLSLENCEPWFDRAILGVVIVQLILIVLRVRPALPPFAAVAMLTNDFRTASHIDRPVEVL